MSVIQDVKNPVYADDTGNAINCDVKVDTVEVYLPFTATNYDTEPHGVEIYNQIKEGKWGPIAAYVPPPPPPPPDPNKQGKPKVVA